MAGKRVEVKVVGWSQAEAKMVTEVLLAEGCVVENIRKGRNGLWFADTNANRLRIRGLMHLIAKRD